MIFQANSQNEILISMEVDLKINVHIHGYPCGTEESHFTIFTFHKLI